MPRKISVTTTLTPSIVVVQGAYDTFCAPTEPATVYEVNGALFGFLNLKQQQIAVAIEESVADWFKFSRLVAEWQIERGVMSSITEAAMCPAYQGIMGMGPVAVPFILAQLESEGDEPDQWFWALKAITGADPVRDEDRGDFVAMAKSWLEWAKTAV